MQNLDAFRGIHLWEMFTLYLRLFFDILKKNSELLKGLCARKVTVKPELLQH